MAQTSIKDRVVNLHKNFGSLEWIAGKWFFNGVEMTNPLRWFLVNTDAKNDKDAEKLMDNFIALYGDYEGDWYDMDIIHIAEERVARGDKGNPLLLNEKELKILNYLLVGEPEYAIFFFGVGGSGKSTICDIYCQIYGRQNCCFKKLADIEKFNVELSWTRLWFDDDLSPYWSDAKSARFKAIITNGPASYEAKGKTPWMGRYRCKFLGACNMPLKFDLSDTGILRRIVYYEKNEKIKNPDRGLIGKKYTNEELIGVVVAALNVDMTDWTKDFEEETHRVIMSGNTVGKYGMTGTYENYVARTQDAGYSPFGEDKWHDIRTLFESWVPHESNRTLF